MKYIRTKDGIKENIYNLPLNELKQSDTIDELIDYYVIFKGKSCPNPLELTKDKEYAKKMNQDFCFDVYGAIHVIGKGLIYVSKMRRGELELL